MNAGVNGLSPSYCELDRSVSGYVNNPLEYLFLRTPVVRSKVGANLFGIIRVTRGILMSSGCYRNFTKLYRPCMVHYKTYTREQVKIKRLDTKPIVIKKPVDFQTPSSIAAYLTNQSNVPIGIKGTVTSEVANDLVNESSSMAAASQSVVGGPSLSSDQLIRLYAGADPSTRELLQTCVGCGSALHCKVAGEPGFIPRELFDELNETFDHAQDEMSVTVMQKPITCVRCILLQQHRDAINTSVDKHAYEDLVVSHLSSEKDATVILIGDMLNLPHSLLPNLNGRLNHLRFILVGNKVDQLPIEHKNYMETWKTSLLEAFNDRCGVPPKCVVHVALISAVTGFGIDKLVDFLLSRRFHSAAPLYLVGTTNVGKSSLFNRLLLSDLCKSEAREAIHRATVSPWPGTTAGLLRFPIVRMDGFKYASRWAAKREHHASPFSSEKKQSVFVPSTGFSYLKPQAVSVSRPSSTGRVSSTVEKIRSEPCNLPDLTTYTWSNHNIRPTVKASEVDIHQLQEQFLPADMTFDASNWDGDRGIRLLSTLFDPRHYNDRAWCIDTPGFLCHDQILNYLSPTELEAISQMRSFGSKERQHLKENLGDTGRILIPRTFVMRPNLTLLLGSLARLDLIQSPESIYFTTFSNLPIHITTQDEVDAYLEEYSNHLHVGRKHDEPPVAGPCGTLPSLSSVQLEPILTFPNKSCSIDVVLSGAGWIGVSELKKKNHSQDNCHPDSIPIQPTGEIVLRAWTPGGLGISLRTPSLIPSASARKGTRMPSTREFRSPA